MIETRRGHRRSFVRAMTLGAIAAPVVVADEPIKPDPPKPSDEVDARMAIVLARFGKLPKLDKQALDTIRAHVVETVRRGAALREISVGNGDAPFPVFHPYRSPPG